MRRGKKSSYSCSRWPNKAATENAIKYSGNCSLLFCKEFNDAFLNPCLLSQYKMTVELITIPRRKLVNTSCVSEYFIALRDTTDTRACLLSICFLSLNMKILIKNITSLPKWIQIWTPIGGIKKILREGFLILGTQATVPKDFNTPPIFTFACQ